MTASQDYAGEERGESGHKSMLAQPTRCGSAGGSLPCISGVLRILIQPERLKEKPALQPRTRLDIQRLNANSR